MSKKSMIAWCFMLGLLDGLYCILCNVLPHIQHFMWIGFISLPIYFLSGATLKLLPRHFCCAVSGVLWGALVLVIMGFGWIQNEGLNMLVVVTVVVAICCYVHLGWLTEDKLGGLFSNCPMVFGGFAAIFSQGIGELPWVIATLTLGLLLGLIMAWVQKPITAWLEKNN